ncbi:MAG: hypothetical protein LBL78_02020 [Prevotellaceae bacterium]|jgi:hypothetical protein|nr:hypothetical protein [Prevotellaceae bacterium]
MTREKHHRLLVVLMFAAAIGMCLYACIDKTYDLDKDIDMTVGLGSDKLTVKIGNTEKIFLRNMLDVDESDIIDTLTTAGKSLYYLVREGSAEQVVTINPIPTFSVADVAVSPETPLLLTPDRNWSLPKGDLTPDEVTAQDTITATIKDIPQEVLRLYRANLQPKQLRLSLMVEQPAYAKVGIHKIKGLTITFPAFIHSPALTDGHLVIPDIEDNADEVITLVPIPIDYMQFGTASEFGQLVSQGTLTEQESIHMDGKFTLQATEAFTLMQGDEANVVLKVELGNFDISTIEGLVDPDISPTVDPIEVAGDVPDFMKDPDVVLEMNNPTIKLTFNGTDRPIPLLFRGEMYGETGDQQGEHVALPEEGFIKIAPTGEQTFYCYQGDAPFDPAGIDAPETHWFFVHNLNSVIRKLPDYIEMDLSGSNIQSDKSMLHTLRPGDSFDVLVNYQMFIPFRFNKGLTIVYNDSIDDLHKDLKKYQADGLTLTAKAVSTIPLELKLSLTPRDEAGKLLTDEIEEATGTITAATGTTDTETETPLTLVMKIKNPAALSRLDRFDIRIGCESTDVGELYSSQYLFLKEVKLQLNGQVIADFN